MEVAGPLGTPLGLVLLTAWDLHCWAALNMPVRRWGRRGLCAAPDKAEPMAGEDRRVPSRLPRGACPWEPLLCQQGLGASPRSAPFP